MGNYSWWILSSDIYPWTLPVSRKEQFCQSEAQVNTVSFEEQVTVQGQISEHISKAKWGPLCLLPLKYFSKPAQFFKTGEYSVTWRIKTNRIGAHQFLTGALIRPAIFIPWLNRYPGYNCEIFECYSPEFSNPACCEKYLKDKAISCPSLKLTISPSLDIAENCSLLGTDNEQIPQHTFPSNEGHCLLILHSCLFLVYASLVNLPNIKPEVN